MSTKAAAQACKHPAIQIQTENLGKPVIWQSKQDGITLHILYNKNSAGRGNNTQPLTNPLTNKDFCNVQSDCWKLFIVIGIGI